MLHALNVTSQPIQVTDDHGKLVECIFRNGNYFEIRDNEGLVVESFKSLNDAFNKVMEVYNDSRR